MADVIFCSVPDDAALCEVVTGLSGVLAASDPAAFFVNVSTVSPATSRDLAKTARPRGVSMIDAAVSGSTPQAEQGTWSSSWGASQAPVSV
jgi:3-hydroxyisobutyrate dehydrogenase